MPRLLEILCIYGIRIRVSNRLTVSYNVGNLTHRLIPKDYVQYMWEPIERSYV